MRRSRFESLEDRRVLSGTPLVIMSLGDSITQGRFSTAHERPSYRAPLQQMLSARGIEFDFVGSHTEHCGESPEGFPFAHFDADHEGHWGWAVDDLVNGTDVSHCGGDAGDGRLADWVPEYTDSPDLVLMHVGTNDIIQSLPNGHAAGVNDLSVDQILSIRNSIEGLIQTVQQQIGNPKTKILLAQLIPGTLIQEEVQALNSQISQIGASRQDVVVVDHYTDFDPRRTVGDTYDDLHPNASGEQHMAERWLDAILAHATVGDTAVGNLGDGAASQEGARGEAFLMYTFEPAQQRFLGVPDNASQHFVVVKQMGGSWHYDDGQNYVCFLPTTSDLLVGHVDYGLKRIQLLENQNANYAGITLGIETSDMTLGFRRNSDTLAIDGLQIGGSQFVVPPPTEAFWMGDVPAGLRASDRQQGEAFVMYSEQFVGERFGPAIDARSAGHLIVVQWNGTRWLYDDDTSMQPFTPHPTDRLLAQIDGDGRRIRLLRGIHASHAGIGLGYLDSDLELLEDRWDRRYDRGEFQIDGSWISWSTDMPEGVWIGHTGQGIAASDSSVGMAFVMYSQQPVRERFAEVSLQAGTSERLILVRPADGVWFYDDNGVLLPFESLPSDRLLAAIDYTSGTIENYVNEIGNEFGIARGFRESDLEIQLNAWNGIENVGEIGVRGSYFVPN